MSDEAILAAVELNIPGTAKLILIAISRLVEKKSNHCSATIKKISELSLVPVRSIYRHLDWLEKNNYLTREKPQGWKIENTFTLTFQKPQKTGYAKSAQRSANLAGLACAGLINQQPTTPLAFQASSLGSDEPRGMTGKKLGSSQSQQKKAPEHVNGKKNGHAIMKKIDARQIDAFNGQRLGKNKRGHFWEASDRVQREWMVAAAKKIETETNYLRVNVRVVADEFEAYWAERRDSRARKSDWRRTYVNRCVEVARRSGYRERDGHFSKDGAYLNDDDYGIGYRP